MYKIADVLRVVNKTRKSFTIAVKDNRDGKEKVYKIEK